MLNAIAFFCFWVLSPLQNHLQPNILTRRAWSRREPIPRVVVNGALSEVAQTTKAPVPIAITLVRLGRSNLCPARSCSRSAAYIGYPCSRSSPMIIPTSSVPEAPCAHTHAPDSSSRADRDGVLDVEWRRESQRTGSRDRRKRMSSLPSNWAAARMPGSRSRVRN
jgi:hypothetical protein